MTMPCINYLIKEQCMTIPRINYLIKHKVIMNCIANYTAINFKASKEMVGHLLIYCMLMIHFQKIKFN